MNNYLWNNIAHDYSIVLYFSITKEKTFFNKKKKSKLSIESFIFDIKSKNKQYVIEETNKPVRWRTKGGLVAKGYRWRWGPNCKVAFVLCRATFEWKGCRLVPLRSHRSRHRRRQRKLPSRYLRSRGPGRSQIGLGCRSSYSPRYPPRVAPPRRWARCRSSPPRCSRPSLSRKAPGYPRP